LSPLAARRPDGHPSRLIVYDPITNTGLHAPEILAWEVISLLRKIVVDGTDFRNENGFGHATYLVIDLISFLNGSLVAIYSEFSQVIKIL
jgi:hypothetical protein